MLVCLWMVQNNSPKEMTKRSYMDAVIEGLKAVGGVDIDFMTSEVNGGSFTDDCNREPRKKIYVRLLLSIDRRETTEAAMETVCRKIDPRARTTSRFLWLNSFAFVLQLVVGETRSRNEAFWCGRDRSFRESESGRMVSHCTRTA